MDLPFIETKTGTQTAKGNRGWFRAGDPRINRRGRPRGPVAVMRKSQQGLPLDGRIMRLLVPEQDVKSFLLGRKTPWLVNLSSDFDIVGAEWDQRGGLACLLWSATFASVQPGDPIPEFQGEYNGLMWRKL